MSEKDFFDLLEYLANDISDMGSALELCFYGVQAAKATMPTINSTAGDAFDFFSRRAHELGSKLVNTKEKYEREGDLADSADKTCARLKQLNMT